MKDVFFILNAQNEGTAKCVLNGWFEGSWFCSVESHNFLTPHLCFSPSKVMCDASCVTSVLFAWRGALDNVSLSAVA